MVTFTDASARSYNDLNMTCSDLPAYEGESKPMESLDALLGSDPNGQWLIEITDFWPHEKGNIKSAVLEFGEYEQPQCSSLSFPENGSFNIPINSIFNWDSSPLATSYYLNLGITPGGNEIYDQLDVGNVLSYDPGLQECEKAKLFSKKFLELDNDPLAALMVDGEVLECEEKLDDALSSYHKALDIYEQNEGYEAPVFLIQKIHELQEKLASKK